MTDSTRFDHDHPPSNDFDRFACPDCSSPLSPASGRCPDCEFAGTIRSGIPSFIPDRHGRAVGGFNDRDLEQLATAVERLSIRDATREILKDREDRSALLSDVYDVRRDAWWPLVRDHVSGTCLEVQAGFGRRSTLLAELAETVYAVDPDLSRLRIAAARDDYESSDRVVPVHTTEDRLPFAATSFDTIVADLTTATGTGIRTRLQHLREYLDDGGSMLFVADAWPRQLGMTDLVGLESEASTGDSGKSFPATASGYRSLVGDLGFDHVSVYALFPTAANPLYVFDAESDHAVRELSDFIFRDTGRLSRSAKRLFELSNRAGVLKRCYPSLLIACTNDSSTSTVDCDDPLLKAGRSRSIVLDVTERGIERVWKIPNRVDHAPLTEREQSILSSLASREAPITETLSTGTVIDAQCVPARTERPVSGQPLADAIDRDADAFGRSLRIGFDWLIDFQQTFRGDTVVRSPAEIREDLRFEPAGLEPPDVDDPVPTFFTPVHGDYMARNIYLNDGAVSAVIDWEYGALEASPIIDAGFFLLDTARQVFGDIRNGFRTVLCGRNEYAARARESVQRYCDALDVPSRTFELYLPAAYVHRLELDWRYDMSSTYLPKMSDRAAIASYVFDSAEQLTVL